MQASIDSQIESPEDVDFLDFIHDDDHIDGDDQDYHTISNAQLDAEFEDESDEDYSEIVSFAEKSHSR